MNEIKLDKIDVPLTVGKTNQNAKQTARGEIKEEGVTVTNNLNRLVNLLNSGESPPNDQARVIETKRMVQSGDYVVNHSVLSEKLIDNGILNNVGE